MVEENEKRDAKMYIVEPDGGYTVIGPVQDLDTTYVYDCDATTTHAFNELTIDSRCRLTQEALMIIFGIRDPVIEHCPNKRVAHLAFHAKKARTRKKNFHRAIKILGV